jgi:predicted metal-dependent hydrolase
MSKTRKRDNNGNGFRKSFASARKSGNKTFNYRGKKYTTETAEEKAKTMKPSNLVDSATKADVRYGKKPTKSNKEIKDSYAKSMKTRFKKDYDSVNKAVLIGPKELDKKYGKK